MQGQNPFPAFLLVLLVVSWTAAQQLQRGLGAAQGRPGAGAFSLHLEAEGRGTAVGVNGGGGVRTAAGSSSQETLPKAQSTITPQKFQNPIVVQRLRSNEKVPTVTGATSEEQDEAKIFEEQARNAKYSFSSVVEDGLNDHMVSREETRDGLKVKGSYSYRDGYFERTVHYEADDNGYRVVGDEATPIGDGPQPDPNGSAHVRSEFGSARSQYKITAADIENFGKDRNENSEI